MLRIAGLKDERGATAILVAASMLMIMGFAAIAIDGGLGFSERRQAQSAVDFASLAALQASVSCPAPCTVAAAADAGALEAKTVVAANLPATTLNWGACLDPTRPAAYVIVSSTECVSFTNNFDQARVVLPDDIINTTFGRAIGTSTITITALAEAEQALKVTNNILPFALGPGGSHACLFTNQTPQTALPCNGSVTGNFGYIDIALYGNDDLGTASTCNSGSSTANRIVSNTVLGVDHNLTLFTGTVVNDHDACPNRSEDVTVLVRQTGSSTGGVTEAMAGPTGLPKPGKLTCAAGGPTCATVKGKNLDHTPLWNFLLPGSCAGGNPAGAPDPRLAMTLCLTAWNPGQGVIFSAAVGSHTRFAAVPSLTQIGVQNAWRIDAFNPVYLETIYAGCNAITCTTVHSPGQTSSGACPNPILVTTASCGWTGGGGSFNIEALTAFDLELGMLPASISATFPGQPGNRDFALLK